MARLAKDGLSRHDGIHTIGSVLATHIHDLFNASVDAKDSMPVYSAAIERLTAQSWFDEYG